MPIKSTACAILALVPALAACGGSSQSSNPAPVTATPPPATATDTSPALPPQPTTTQATVPTQTTTTASPARTRIAPAPAFTRSTGGTPAGGDLRAAVATLRGIGFTPVSTAAYDPNQTLRLLVGARTGDGHAQQAFFFDETKYLGTDSASPSGMITVTGHDDTDVTLRYGIFRPGDPACCPSGTARTVRFTLDGGHLVPLDPIPGAAARR